MSTFTPNFVNVDLPINELQMHGSLLAAPRDMQPTPAYRVQELNLRHSPPTWEETKTSVSFHVVSQNFNQRTYPILFLKVTREDIVDGKAVETVLLDGEINCNRQK